uniref:Uncharacterized protein n=1 Tax=Molossus molossus TaxID=27622 RepID=A0A7J8C8I1_MOLMO|nr:hypothetical protein HJG59_009843 [Molossus molossus]
MDSSAELQHQKQHKGEKWLQRQPGTASFVKDCKVCDQGSHCLWGVCEGLPGQLKISPSMATPTPGRMGPKRGEGNECGAASHKGKTLFDSGSYMKDLNCKRTLVQHQRVLTRERGYMCSELEKLLQQKIRASMTIGEFTLGKSLMSVGNVGSHLGKALALFNTVEFTLEQGLMNVTYVENYLAISLISLNIEEFTLEKDHMSVVNVGSPLVKALHSFSTAVFTLEKGLMNVVNVGNSLRTTPVS